MNVLKQLTHFLQKKKKEYNPNVLFLSPLEMNTVFGGKPEEEKREDSYWWIEDSDAPNGKAEL